jgi:hypothetical protein
MVELPRETFRLKKQVTEQKNTPIWQQGKIHKIQIYECIQPAPTTKP